MWTARTGQETFPASHGTFASSDDIFFALPSPCGWTVVEKAQWISSIDGIIPNISNLGDEK
jgi:hypothetical protein